MVHGIETTDRQQKERVTMNKNKQESILKECVFEPMIADCADYWLGAGEEEYEFQIELDFQYQVVIPATSTQVIPTLVETTPNINTFFDSVLKRQLIQLACGEFSWRQPEIGMTVLDTPVANWNELIDGVVNGKPTIIVQFQDGDNGVEFMLVHCLSRSIEGWIDLRIGVFHKNTGDAFNLRIRMIQKDHPELPTVELRDRISSTKWIPTPFIDGRVINRLRGINASK
jgi:hypothetical protein